MKGDLDQRTLARLREREVFPADMSDEAVKKTFLFASARLNMAVEDLGRAYLAGARKTIDAFRRIF